MIKHRSSRLLHRISSSFSVYSFLAAFAILAGMVFVPAAFAQDCAKVPYSGLR